MIATGRPLPTIASEPFAGARLAVVKGCGAAAAVALPAAPLWPLPVALTEGGGAMGMGGAKSSEGAGCAPSEDGAKLVDSADSVVLEGDGEGELFTAGAA